MHPETYPATHDTIRNAHPVMLVPTGNRRRQLLFLPWLVLKLGIGRRERDAFTREARHATEAAAHEFWSDLALPPRRVPFVGMAMRRHEAVRLKDYAAIDRMLVARLERARDWSVWRSLPFFLWRNAHTSTFLSGPLPRINGVMLPMTAMHGDMHMFNFVRIGARFGLLDWERFDSSGSFVYDFLDFRLTNAQRNARQDGYAFLAALRPDAPSIAFAAHRLGVDPEALVIFYSFTKINAMVARRGGLECLPADQRLRAEEVLVAQARAAGA